MPNNNQELRVVLQRAQEELRNTLKRAREDANLTQQELADAIGTGVRTVGGAESGGGNPEFDTLFRLVRYLNIPGDAIFYPETLKCTPEQDVDRIPAYRQLQTRIAGCNEQEIKMLNALAESMLRVTRSDSALDAIQSEKESALV